VDDDATIMRKMKINMMMVMLIQKMLMMLTMIVMMDATSSQKGRFG
jgi:hypothetical protein